MAHVDEPPSSKDLAEGDAKTCHALEVGREHVRFREKNTVTHSTSSPARNGCCKVTIELASCRVDIFATLKFAESERLESAGVGNGKCYKSSVAERVSGTTVFSLKIEKSQQELLCKRKRLHI